MPVSEALKILIQENNQQDIANYARHLKEQDLIDATKWSLDSYHFKACNSLINATEESTIEHFRMCNLRNEKFQEIAQRENLSDLKLLIKSVTRKDHCNDMVHSKEDKAFTSEKVGIFLGVTLIMPIGSPNKRISSREGIIDRLQSLQSNLIRKFSDINNENPEEWAKLAIINLIDGDFKSISGLKGKQKNNSDNSQAIVGDCKSASDVQNTVDLTNFSEQQGTIICEEVIKFFNNTPSPSTTNQEAESALKNTCKNLFI